MMNDDVVMSTIFGKESIGPITTLLNNLPALEDNPRKVGEASKYSGAFKAIPGMLMGIATAGLPVIAGICFNSETALLCLYE